METRDLAVELPFEVRFEGRAAGGPDAGLAYALVIADILSSTDVARGRTIAAAGTVDADGHLAPAHELAATASAEAGADVVVLPPGQADGARRDGLQVVGGREPGPGPGGVVDDGVTFRHGVASGDPLPDSVVLWTRSPGATEVEWVVARDPELRQVVARGTAATSADVDHTVKVDPGGLEPATTYWYRFSVGDDHSPTGRTRTAPAPGASVDHLRLGLVSCASYAAGWFHAYRNLARRDVDLVVHVGDYLYENGRHLKKGPRNHPPRRAVTLDGYRARHALYKTDHDLQALHARHPMVAVWDDHELVGGAWSGGAHEHVPRLHGSWADRKAAAVRAYWEWMPLRQPDPAVPERIYRMLRWGDLADLALLDTRLIGRDEPVGRGNGVVVKVSDTGRSMLGEDQRTWLATEMAASTARWRVLASQVVLAPIPLLAGRLLNPGQWDGYPEERDWLFRVLGAARGARPGDQHPRRQLRRPQRRHPLVVGQRAAGGGRVRGAVGVVPRLRRHPRPRWPAGPGRRRAHVPVAEPPRADGRAPPPRLRRRRRHPRADPGRLVAPRHGDGPVAGGDVRRRLAAPLGPPGPDTR